LVAHSEVVYQVGGFQMQDRSTNRRAALVAGALVGLVITTGCGSVEAPTKAVEGSTGSAAADLGDGDWLLRFTVESGGDGEAMSAVYVTYNPATGAAKARRLPAVMSPDTYSDTVAVLVSGDRKWALLDARIPKPAGPSGKVRVYATGSDASRVVDVRALTGVADLRAVGAAFDPREPELLRVVDSERRVWKLDLVGGTGARDGDLPSHPGWFFANGFDKNTGLPYIEDTDSEATLPAGNGIGDIRPVLRDGGQIRIDDGTEHAGEPAEPCGFAGGFVTAEETVWIFCADTARISAYRLDKGAEAWEPVGKASPSIVPAAAAEVPVVLPPVQGARQ
jgi:hypothetical protein